MLYLILFLFLFGRLGLSQSACQFFSSGNNNYTAWSQNHIDTWCKDHDPSSTSQCAIVIWPPYMPYPGRVDLRRNFKEWLLQAQPQIGTRKDCIARSAALQINSTKRENNLTEAVTCDLFYFHPKRRQECVCFPVYDDYVSTITTVITDVYKVFTTTSTFYPPEQVVESCLLAAATQGPPSTCDPPNSQCTTSASVVSRKPRILGGFPYCPTPGQQVQQHLAARTVVPISSKAKKTCDTDKSWGALPTEKPKCIKVKARDAHSKCINDKCMWSFIRSYESFRYTKTTDYDPYGWPNTTSSLTVTLSITEPHWGIAVTTDHVKATDAFTSMWQFVHDEDRAAEYRSKTSLSGYTFAHVQPLPHPPTPVCTSETDCRCWCELEHKRAVKSMLLLLYVCSAASTVALLGIMFMIHGEKIRRRWRERRGRRRRRGVRDTQDTELVRIDNEGSSYLSNSRSPIASDIGRDRVHFRGDRVDGSADTSLRARYGSRRTYGYETHSARSSSLEPEVTGNNTVEIRVQEASEG